MTDQNNALAKNDPDYIRWLLTMNDRAVERAMVALYQRQTADEQSTGSTRLLNGAGFNAFDAKTGSYYARWVMGGRSLTGRHLDKARRMAGKYVRQLAEIATETLALREAERAREEAEERAAIQAE